MCSSDLRYYPRDGQTAFLGLSYSLYNKAAEGFDVVPEYDSPASAAGIAEGDVLLAVDGVTITEPYQDWQMMRHYQPGDRVEVLVLRGGQRKIIPVTLGPVTDYLDEFPHVRHEGDPWTGFYFAYSQPYERDIEDVQLSVIDVVAGSPAEQAGFKTGDLIFTVPG